MDEETLRIMDQGSFSVYRFYFDSEIPPRLMKSHISLDEAQRHCQDPETSSRTATSIDAKIETEEMGPWFDGYEED